MKTTREYIRLVQEFPLVPIKSNAEYKIAMQVSVKLGMKDLSMTSVERDYYRVLAMLIRDYENSRIKHTGSVSPEKLLQSLLEEYNLKQADIARIIGHESQVSAFLVGKRNLSKGEAIKLGNYFAIDPQAFLPPVLEKAS